MTNRFSPLDAVHRGLGAKMVPFGGWEMPLAYPSGTLVEHAACRASAALFDVSHLGTVRLEGPGAYEVLQSTLTNDLGKIEPGRAQYTHLLDDSDASVTDDIIVWWLAEDVFDVMPNASNTDGVRSAIGGIDITATRAVMALQGPTAREVMAKVSEQCAAIGRFRVAHVEVHGVPCVVAGTGYTGEDGLELAVPAESSHHIWSSLVEAGAMPAGLGARDTLRLEAALPLHGHELGKGITSLQAGLEWVVSWSKPTFRGREALAREKSVGPGRVLRGISIEGRRPARDGSIIRSSEEREVGVVTSGNFSPTLGHCIALALCDPSFIVGDAVKLDVRDISLDGHVCSTPFVSKK